MSLSPYLRVPRWLCNAAYSTDPDTQKLYRLLLCIYIKCYHTDGAKRINGTEVPCNRGQLVTTLRTLESYTFINYRTIKRLLEDLRNMEYIRLEVTGRYHKITIDDYNKMANPTGIKTRMEYPY